jgi:hypothetical protein
MNFDSWRPFIAKFIAPIIGFCVTFLNKKYGIEFSDAETGQLIASLVDLVVFAVSTGISAVAINKKVNPGNAASSHLAAAEKVQSEQIKQSTSEYEALK